MSPTTPNFAIPYPTPADPVKNGATDMQAIADRLDLVLPGFLPKSLVDAKGDLIVASGADALARLGVGADGQVLTADAAAAAGVKWAAPASGGGIGLLGYAERTSAIAITATTRPTGQTVLSTAAINLAAVTPVVEIECWIPQIDIASLNAQMVLDLYDGGTMIGALAGPKALAANAVLQPLTLRRRLTGVAAGSHTWSVKAWVTAGTGNVYGGSGGTVDYVAAYIKAVTTA